MNFQINSKGPRGRIPPSPRVKSFYAILIILQIILQISCRPKIECDKGDTIEHYYLPSKYIDSFPYNGSETLIFLSDHSDTAIFIGTGKRMGHELTESYNLASADCPQMKKIFIDIVNYTFPCQNKSNFDYLELTCKAGYPHRPVNCLLDLSIYFKIHETSTFDYLIETSIADSILYKGNYLGGVFFDRNSDVLFNKNFGIIRFKEPNGTVWTLLNKI